VEIDGKIMDGFHTLSKKLEFFSEWFAEWKWPEYAVPIYPHQAQREQMIHLVTQVHHDFMTKENEFALNTVFSCHTTFTPVQSTPTSHGDKSKP